MTMGLCLEEKCGIQLLGSWIQIMVETLIIAGRLQGMYLLFAGAPICWRSVQQPIVAMSTTEAEYMALGEAIWVQGLVSELGVDQEGVQLHCNSKIELCLAKNQVYHGRTKHIRIRFHKIRELAASGEVLLEKVHTLENHVNMLTKPVTTEKFKHCLDLLRVCQC